MDLYKEYNDRNEMYDAVLKVGQRLADRVVKEELRDAIEAELISDVIKAVTFIIVDIAQSLDDIANNQ